MVIFILLLCFIAIFLSLCILAGSRVKAKEILLRSVLIYSALLVFITETASVFRLLNYQVVLLAWIGISILTSYFLFSNKLIGCIKALKQDIADAYHTLSKYEKCLFFSVVIVLAFVLIQGIVYPPNNYDSMTYHMARITNWISHQSVAHYPTHITRQLFQPPFSEFVIMNFNILNCGDYFSNSVQLLFLIFSLFAVVSIVDLFGLGLQYKLTAIILAVTVPEVVLQASSTQNDIVVSFFILTSIYYAVKSVKEEQINNYLFLGLSIGLGVLTKGTAYIYLAPILLLFAVAYFVKVYKTRKYAHLGWSIFVVIIIISINAGHYIRNYNLNGNILGVEKADTKALVNENMTPKLLLANIIKNAGLHIGSYPINKISDNIIYKLCAVAGIDINAPGTNFQDKKYCGTPLMPNHEDYAANPIHAYLILLSFILIGWNAFKNKNGFSAITLYLAMLLLQGILFCLYLKWQPWHTRLHTPLFMLSAPLISYAVSLNNRYKKILYKVIPIIIIYAILVALFNWTRPFMPNKYTAKISITDKRYKKYFTNNLGCYEEYNALVENMRKMNNKNIGLMSGGDDWEYPLFSQFYGRGVNPIHINVSNISKDIPVKQNNIDCIVSTNTNDTLIIFSGRNFYNQNANNVSIWLYRAKNINNHQQRQ